jgi:hypothetical protein
MDEQHLRDELELAAELAAGVAVAARDGEAAVTAAVMELTGGRARLALAMLATTHAANTAGGARVVPEAGIAELVCTEADEGGFLAACRLVDAYSTPDVRAALANLALAFRGQRGQEMAARIATGEN